MLIPRLIVALAGIPLLLGATYMGGWWLLLLVIILAALGQLEFYQMATRLKLQPLIPAGIASGLFLILLAYLYRDMMGWPGMGLTMGMLLIFLALFPRVALGDVAITLLGSWYVGGFLAYVPLIRFLPGGSGALFLTFFLTWANDTGAYFCGRLFGRRHPWPRLSPGKTWAGSLGGLLVTILAARVLGPWLLPGSTGWLLLGMGFLVAIAAQVGDLLESGFKRQAGVKDSGWILPGHGGILDRFDSLLLVAPVVYYYLTLFLPKME